MVRPARFSFRQLRQWRNQVQSEVLLKVPDVVWIDLDEARNEVAIGLVDGSGRAEVERVLAGLGIPADGTKIEISGRVVLQQALTDRVRPIEGGLANAVTFNGVSQLIPWCTFGFNAIHNGVDVVLTASHCTQQTFGLDGTPTVFYQNSVTSGDEVGPEWLDPPHAGGHRFSDAVMIRFNSGVSFDLGRIARTTIRSTTWGVAGSTTIDPSHPQFRIASTQEYPTAGQMVEKVGRATGWTAGLVRHTCIPVSVDGYTRDCTYMADYWSLNGDSGSPVFIWYATDYVTLVGIHWGKMTNGPQGTHTLFSPWGGVVLDFGSMTVVAGVDPLSVSIVYDGDYWYHAAPAGGYSPYVSFYWEWCGIDCEGNLAPPASRSGVLPNVIVHGWQFLSTDQWVYWRESQRWLRVTVTDSQSQQAVATYWVP